jgi:hypothetical protein
LLWSVFGIAYLFNKQAWINVQAVDAAVAIVGTGWWTTFLYIVLCNTFICFLIALGNIFARFSFITPGVIVLIIQAVTIGWIAGSNGFEVPFAGVKEANLQFLKIGLWETTAYALTCAATLPKSLMISDTLIAKKWSETHKLRDLRLDMSEKIILILSLTVLIIAAIVEAFAIAG